MLTSKPDIAPAAITQPGAFTRRRFIFELGGKYLAAVDNRIELVQAHTAAVQFTDLHAAVARLLQVQAVHPAYEDASIHEIYI